MSNNARSAIKLACARLVKAAREHAFRGTRHPEDAIAIDHEYVAAKEHWKKTVDTYLPAAKAAAGLPTKG